MNNQIFQADYKLNATFLDDNKKTINYVAILNNTHNEETKKVFNIKISKEELKKLKDAKINSLASKVSIAGFRPGKVPASVIWTHYQQNITSDILNDSLNNVIMEISKAISADLITSPKIDLKKFDINELLECEITLETLPEIKLPEVKEISLDKHTYEVKDSDLAERIKEIAKLRKNFIEAKDSHKAQEGDQVIIDFEGKIDGVAFPGGAAKGHALELGSKSFIDTFENQLVGHKKGAQVLVKVTFPENYHEAKFAGKAAEFDVKIQEIKQSKEFENDEELAKAIGFTSLEELKSKVKESLEKQANHKVMTELKLQLFDKLDQLVNFTLPQSMVEQEFSTLWQQVKEIQKQTKDQTKTEEELKEEYQKLAKRRVKLGILLSKMSSKYSIKIEQQDYIDAVRAQIDAQHPSLAQSIIQYYNSNPKAVEALKGPILEEKTVQEILKEVKFVEKNIELKKLLTAEEE